MANHLNGQNGFDNDVMIIQEKFNNVLSPTEPMVMRIQSLLVWEKPRQSALLFVGIHAIFWYLAITRHQFVFLFALASIVLYLVYTWKRKIWPEIRVPPPIPEDVDDWTPVHPRLLSIPEICQHLAQIWCSSLSCITRWRLFRRNHPYRFGLISSFCFASLAVVGHYLPGIMLSYIFVITIMLWPCVLYHNILQKIYMKFEPYFMRLDYRLKIKSKWTFWGEKSSKKDDGDTFTYGEDEDFSLNDDPATTAALAKAITDSEDESGTPSLPTPHLSKCPSVDNSEDEQHKEDIEFMLTKGLENIPSYDDDLEQTDDELLETNKLEPKVSRESMNFVPSHFDDESGSDEDTLTRDMTFPDVNSGSSRTSQTAKEMVSSSLAQAFVAQTFSSVMGSALQSLATLAQSHEKDSSPDTQHSVSYSRDSQDSIQIQPTETSLPVQTSASQRRASDESSDIDIDEEFEFLDEYDVDDEKSEK